jgi:hypothetical protein
MEPFAGNMASISQWHISTTSAVIFPYIRK